MRITRLLLPALALSSASVGCANVDRETQITLSVVAETTVPDELQSLEVIVTSADGSSQTLPYRVSSPTFFPSTLTVVPQSERSLEAPITIEVRSAGVGAIQRRARLNFVRGRALLLPIPLRMACLGFRECAANESCVGGLCQSADVDSASLPDFAEHDVFGGDAGTDATCFDEGACLAGEQTVSVAQDCTFPLPQAPAPEGKRPHLNVAVQWLDASHRLIALPFGDEREGWTTITPTLGRLSAGVCTSLFEPGRTPEDRAVPERAVAIYASTACLALVAQQPFCRGADAHVGVGRVFQ